MGHASDSSISPFIPHTIEDLLSLPKDLHGVANKFRQQNIENSIAFFGSARIAPQTEAVIKLEEAKSAPQGPDYLKNIKIAEKMLFMSQFYTQTEELAYKLTTWTLQEPQKGKNFLLCSGGGPGIMEACNKGAQRAGGRSIGLAIAIAREQKTNSYISSELNFRFDTFMLRKFWFFYFMKALVVFPGGFGTLDEAFEALTLITTQKIKNPIPFLFFDSKYWKSVINFDILVEYGTVTEAEAKTFCFVDTVEEAFTFLTENLTKLYLQ